MAEIHWRISVRENCRRNMAPILSRLAAEVNEKPLRHPAPGALRSRHYLFQAGFYEVPLDKDSVLLLRALPT
jgi:hypothetical protein